MHYVLLFILIQAVNIPLAIVGIPICAALAAAAVVEPQYNYNKDKIIFVWPKSFWLWSNDEDGVMPPGYNTRWKMFVWTALRNPVNNLRFVPGVSKPGRPLWYWSNGKYYAKAGWAFTTGWPMLSAGSGKGY